MSNAAAWVQAIGSLVGIGVAIWVPWHQHRLQVNYEKNTEKLKARAMANAIYIHIRGLEAKTKGAVNNVKANYAAHINAHQYNYLARLKISPSDVLLEDMDRFWILGEKIAVPLLQAISISQSYDSLMDTVINDLNSGIVSAQDAQTTEDGFLTYTDAILKLLPDINEAISPLIDGKTS